MRSARRGSSLIPTPPCQICSGKVLRVALIDLARERALTLCTSLALLAELAEVIGRPQFAPRLQAAGLSATTLLQDYVRFAEIVEPQPLPEPVSRDPDDDAVLATALATLGC